MYIICVLFSIVIGEAEGSIVLLSSEFSPSSFSDVSFVSLSEGFDEKMDGVRDGGLDGVRDGALDDILDGDVEGECIGLLIVGLLEGM